MLILKHNKLTVTIAATNTTSNNNDDDDDDDDDDIFVFLSSGSALPGAPLPLPLAKHTLIHVDKFKPSHGHHYQVICWPACFIHFTFDRIYMPLRFYVFWQY